MSAVLEVPTPKASDPRAARRADQPDRRRRRWSKRPPQWCASWWTTRWTPAPPDRVRLSRPGGIRAILVGTMVAASPEELPLALGAMPPTRRLARRVGERRDDGLPRRGAGNHRFGGRLSIASRTLDAPHGRWRLEGSRAVAPAARATGTSVECVSSSSPRAGAAQVPQEPRPDRGWRIVSGGAPPSALANPTSDVLLFSVDENSLVQQWRACSPALLTAAARRARTVPPATARCRRARGIAHPDPRAADPGGAMRADQHPLRQSAATCATRSPTAVRAAYEDACCFTARQPSSPLFIDIAPSLVDVNASHPTKIGCAS